MSLTLALPDYRDQMESLKRLLMENKIRIAELEEELREEKLKSAAVQTGVTQLRYILAPLHQAMQRVFGEIDDMDIETAAPQAAPVRSAKSAAWESWKQKLGGNPAKAIDALMQHGPMNRTQLRIQLACATRTVTDVVYKLNQAGLINKAGGKISLKEL